MGKRRKNRRWRKKKKQIGQRSESRGSMGCGKGGPFPLPRIPLGSLPLPLFFLFDPVFCLFFPTAEPGPRLRVYEKRSKGTRKTGNKKLATCFATLLQNELNNDFARFTTHEKNLATSLSARQIRTPWLSLALK